MKKEAGSQGIFHQITTLADHRDKRTIVTTHDNKYSLCKSTLGKPLTNADSSCLQETSTISRKEKET